MAVANGPLEIGAHDVALVLSPLCVHTGPAAERRILPASGIDRQRANFVQRRCVLQVVPPGAPKQGGGDAGAEIAPVSEDVIDAAALEVGDLDLFTHGVGLLVPLKGSALNGAVIREARVLKAVVVIEQPVELDAPEPVAVIILVHPPPGIVNALIDRPKVVDRIGQQPVANQRAARRDEDVKFVLLIEPRHGVVSARGRGMLHVRHVAAQRIRLKVPPDGELPAVRSPFGDRIDDAARGASELGAKAAGLELKLVVELKGNGARPKARAEVRHVHAVDVIDVLGDGGAAERGVAEAGAVLLAAPACAERRVPIDRAGRHQHHRIGVTRDRQPLDVAGGHDAGGLRAGDVNRR